MNFEVALHSALSINEKARRPKREKFGASSVQRDDLMNDIVDVPGDRLHKRTVPLVHLLVDAQHIVLGLFDAV